MFPHIGPDELLCSGNVTINSRSGSGRDAIRLKPVGSFTSTFHSPEKRGHAILFMDGPTGFLEQSFNGGFFNITANATGMIEHSFPYVYIKSFARDLGEGVSRTITVKGNGVVAGNTRFTFDDEAQGSTLGLIVVHKHEGSEFTSLAFFADDEKHNKFCSSFTAGRRIHYEGELTGSSHLGHMVVASRMELVRSL